MSSSFAIPKSLDKPIKRLDMLFAQAFSSDSPAMQDWVTVRFALNAAQPQENKERAENSLASPVQQLHPEIAPTIMQCFQQMGYGDAKDSAALAARVVAQLSGV